MKLIMCLFLTVLGANAFALKKGGDFSGSGGGAGVACFPTSKDADEADLFIQKNEALPQDLFEKSTLKVLERWELDQSGIAVQNFEKEKSWEDVLQTVKENLHLVSPLFSEKMNRAAEWMNFVSWEKSSPLARLEDAHPQQPLPPECRLVQLAIRYSSGNNAKGDGPVAGKITLRVVLDERAFQKLDRVDRAMLVLHEQFYAMAQAVGHDSSDQVRNFVRILFNAKSTDWHEESAGGVILTPFVWFLQQKLIENFGDYVLYFTGLEAGEEAPLFTAKHQLATFVSLLKEMRNYDGPCRKENELNTCRQKTMSYMLTRKDLSDEQFFLFSSFFFLQQSVRVLNAESIMDVTKDQAAFADAMGVACRLIFEKRSLLKDPRLLDQSVRYCDKFLGVQPGK